MVRLRVPSLPSGSVLFSQFVLPLARSYTLCSTSIEVFNEWAAYLGNNLVEYLCPLGNGGVADFSSSVCLPLGHTRGLFSIALSSMRSGNAEVVSRLFIKLTTPISFLSVLKTEVRRDSCLVGDEMNHNLLFCTGRSDSNPGKYKEGYGKLRSWVHSSLDLYKVCICRLALPMCGLTGQEHFWKWSFLSIKQSNFIAESIFKRKAKVIRTCGLEEQCIVRVRARAASNLMQSDQKYWA